MNVSSLKITSFQQHILEEISKNKFCIIKGDVLKTNLFFNELIFKEFRESWNNLTLDNFMNDGGKYRYRRYLVFNYISDSQKLIDKPSEPHYQETNVNYLNGGIKRYFSNIEDHIKSNLFLVRLINFCIDIIGGIKYANKWHIETHQFRIISTSDINGLPTPEGIHRDGVDYVFIMFISKENMTGGESHIYDNKKNLIISYTMEETLDCAFLDDTKVLHSVSPITTKLKVHESYRDVLVITFRKL